MNIIKRKIIKFNLNEHIKFRPVGEDALKLCKDNFIEIDNKGWAETQLWCFCHIFGPKFSHSTFNIEHLGCRPNIELVKETFSIWYKIKFFLTNSRAIKYDRGQ